MPLIISHKCPFHLFSGFLDIANTSKLCPAPTPGYPSSSLPLHRHAAAPRLPPRDPAASPAASGNRRGNRRRGRRFGGGELGAFHVAQQRCFHRSRQGLEGFIALGGFLRKKNGENLGKRTVLIWVDVFWFLSDGWNTGNNMEVPELSWPSDGWWYDFDGADKLCRVPRVDLPGFLVRTVKPVKPIGLWVSEHKFFSWCLSTFIIQSQSCSKVRLDHWC